jgi:hypothetical protein
MRIVSIAWPLVGVGLVGFGLWCIYPPLCPIGVGALMLADYVHERLPKRKQ